MAYACNCKGITEGTLRERLAEAAGPVSHKEIHRELGGNDNECCCRCRSPKGDRLFVEIINEHNAGTGPKPGPG